MESYISLNWLIFLSTILPILIILVLIWTNTRKSSTRKTPPGPPGWPVVGNIFDLGLMPHEDFYKLRPKYGPVLWLKLGSVNTMVIQSAKAAAELFKNHDLAFSDRPVTDAFTACNYNQGSLAIGNYSPYWRVLRKICSMELLVNKRINDSVELREKCIDQLVHWIEEESASSHAEGRSGEVELTHLLFFTAFNIVGNQTMSRDILGPTSKAGKDFFTALSNLVEYGGAPNLADFLPFLKWIDPQRIKTKVVKNMKIVMDIAASFVKDRIQENASGRKKMKKDFLDMLLEYEGDGKEGVDKISEKNIIIIILEMFIAGSETTSSTTEWALTELLRNPESMRKVKEELHSVIGVTNRKIKESDIDKLPYLHAVVKEALRLHPPLPLLIPRNSMIDTNYMGYDIPKNTQVYVNAWAIGRDPDAWEDALSFKPERFLGSNIDYKGQHFELIPFGSGRRICVGMTLGHRVVHLGLATLLWTFDWELDGYVTPETMDMKGKLGMTLRKLVGLKAIPRKRTVLE